MGVVGEHDFFVSDDLAADLSTREQIIDGPFLFAADPPDPPFGEIAQMFPIVVGPVEYDDFTIFKPSTQLSSFTVIIVLGGVDNCKARQKTLHIQSHMGLGCCLAAAVLCPIHAIGYQFDGRGIDDLNRATETAKWSWEFSFTILRKGLFQVFQDGPKKFLCHLGRPNLIGMRETIATGWRGCPHARKGRGVESKTITDIVESNRTSQLGEKHRHDMTP